jgi:hypothetical protein
MTIFRGYRGDDALVVTEDGTTVVVPAEILVPAGLRQLRTGQRLVLELNASGVPAAVRIP